MVLRSAAAPLACLLLLTACSSQTPDAGSGSSRAEAATTDDGHGAVAGAEEVAEPQLHLIGLDRTGAVGALDLLTEETAELGTVAPPSAVATDGRYVWATTADGVEVVDSGVWTWNHGDHDHYYRAAPRLLGTVAGEGPVTVSTGPLSTAGGTGLLFPRTGEAVLLDNSALADGALEERFRLTLPPHDGVVAPLGDGAVVSVPDAAGAVTHVEVRDADGTVVEGTRTPCAAASGAITTTVGLAVGCAEGALLWTLEEDQPVVEQIPYPARAEAPAATDFSARKHRPTVAGLAGRAGFWLLDTRERSWQLHRTRVPLLRVAAVDDDDEHVVALDRTGRVRVYDGATGRQLATTAPLLAASLRDPDLSDGVTLSVDHGRAYVNAPAEAVVLEIDYADGARVARELTTPSTAHFLAETGR